MGESEGYTFFRVFLASISANYAVVARFFFFFFEGSVVRPRERIFTHAFLYPPPFFSLRSAKSYLSLHLPKRVPLFFATHSLLLFLPLVELTTFPSSFVDFCTEGPFPSPRQFSPSTLLLFVQAKEEGFFSRLPV